MIVGSQVLLGSEDVEQDAVQQVASGTGVIFYQDILQFHDLHLYLVVTFAEDRYIVFRVFLPSQQATNIREDHFFFV